MGQIPKEIKDFKILFIIVISYQVASVYGLPYLVKLPEVAAVIIGLVGALLYIAFLVRLHGLANILKLNNVIAIYPWLLIVIQLILTSSLIFPAMIMPIYVWIKSKKLLQVDFIKTYDDKKFMIPPK